MLIAVMDPTSRGEGGAARLRYAGVDVRTHVLEEEALVVLGPWLAALSHRRPVLHLLIQTDAAGNAAALSAEALAEIEIERHAHDLLISLDGSAEEGRTGSHGRGFSVPTIAVPDEPEGALAVLAEAGARTVLLMRPVELGEAAAQHVAGRPSHPPDTGSGAVAAHDHGPRPTAPGRLHTVPDFAHGQPTHRPRRVLLTRTHAVPPRACVPVSSPRRA